MVGQLATWHKELAEKGLVVIDVDDGSKDRQIDAVKKHIEEKDIKYATLWDKDGKVTRTYEIHAFPSQYLIGVDGTVIWEGGYLRDKAKADQLIAQELAKIK
jgi:peroxiredoxin